MGFALGWFWGRGALASWTTMPVRFRLPLAASLVALLTFVPLYPWVGDATIAVAIPPIVLWGNASGRGGGTAAGLAHVSANYLMLEWLGRWPPPLGPMLPFWFASAVLVGIGLLAGYFGEARTRLHDEVLLRREIEKDLRAALLEVKALEGILPICAKCKKIRSNEDKWIAVELFIQERSQASFTHGICPTCTGELDSA